jgi:hypothetical protein
MLKIVFRIWRKREDRNVGARLNFDLLVLNQRVVLDKLDNLFFTGDELIGYGFKFGGKDVFISYKQIIEDNLAFFSFLPRISTQHQLGHIVL